MGKIAVVAIGGNALIKSGQIGTIQEQMTNACEAAAQLMPLIKNGWRVALVHGNGPQVGFILRRSEVARDVAPSLSLDMCVADSQGGIGYILDQALSNAIDEWGLQRTVASIITRVQVDPEDPAFHEPTKPIGEFYSEAEAEQYRSTEGWDLVSDAGRGWRRVVASPRPLRFIESDAIRALVEHGVITICAGGGGIPVIATKEGFLRGVAAVVDKDYASALLARMLAADLLLITTGVERVVLNYGTANEIPLHRLPAADARAALDQGQFPPGSMGPKINAALEFLESGGSEVLITNFENVQRALNHETGTWITS